MGIERPNILLVFPDQLSARWTGIESGARVQTPCLDRFAEESVRFSQAYTASPVCTPFRGALFTGLYPTQSGVRWNGQRLPAKTGTLMDWFNDAGYLTSYIGKWHLGGEPQALRRVLPDERGGFQRFVGWESHHVDHFNGMIFSDETGDVAQPMPGHETDALTEMIIEHLHGLAEDGSQPFFLACAYQAPHPPCTPTEQYGKMYETPCLNWPPTTDEQAFYDKPGWNAVYDLSTFRQRYFGEITQMDAAFGRILGALSESGLDRNTIVIFTSDHGEMAGAHGRYSKHVMMDESVRVPLYIRHPDGAKNATNTSVVGTLDLHQSMLEMAGLSCNVDSDGRSFLPEILQGDLRDPARVIFSEYETICVVQDGYKLIAERDTIRPLAFYDLESDPFESRDLLLDDVSENDPQSAERLACMLELIRKKARLAGILK